MRYSPLVPLRAGAVASTYFGVGDAEIVRLALAASITISVKPVPTGVELALLIVTVVAPEAVTTCVCADNTSHVVEPVDVPTLPEPIPPSVKLFVERELPEIVVVIVTTYFTHYFIAVIVNRGLENC